MKDEQPEPLPAAFWVMLVVGLVAAFGLLMAAGGMAGGV